VFDYNFRRWAGPFYPAAHGPTVDLEQGGGLSFDRSTAGQTGKQGQQRELGYFAVQGLNQSTFVRSLPGKIFQLNAALGASSG
jgi:hypothetical protein